MVGTTSAGTIPSVLAATGPAEVPIGRFGTVDEIAPTVLMLASEAGAFYVGQTLSPNGGDVMV